MQPEHADDEAAAGALSVAKLGIRVVPVWGIVDDGGLRCMCPAKTGCTSPGKHPIERDWQRLATVNANRIAHWAKIYRGCNFGALGDDLITIDIDPQNGGALGMLPSWVTKTNYAVSTGGGGWHLGYKPPDHPVSNAHVANGIDLKATGGYVVCPGSLHIRGRRYRWVSRPRDPEAWVPWPDPRPEHQEMATARSQLATLLQNPAQVGDRNNWVAQVAGHYALAFPYRDAYEVHVAQANALLSQPLDEAELAKTADSIWTTERAKPEGGVAIWNPVDLGSLIDSPPPASDRFGPGNMLYRSEVHWLAGEPESGKSILAYAAAVEEMKRENPVLLLDEDAGTRDAVIKLAALGATGDMVDQYMTYLPPGGRDLFKDWGQLMELVLRKRPTLVILDAAADHLAAADRDEDRARDVTRFINRVLKPLTHQHGICVVVIDHKTKADPDSRYGRGSGAKLAKTEVGYNILTPEPFSRHRSGRLHIVCTKDKPGVIGRGTSWMVRVIVSGGGQRIQLVVSDSMSPDQTKKMARSKKTGTKDVDTETLVVDVLSRSLIELSISEMHIPKDRTTISRCLVELERAGIAESSPGDLPNSKKWRLTEAGRADWGTVHE